MKPTLLTLALSLVAFHCSFSQNCLECTGPVITFPFTGVGITIMPGDVLDVNSCPGILLIHLEDPVTGDTVVLPGPALFLDCSLAQQTWRAVVTDTSCAATCATFIQAEDVEFPVISCGDEETVITNFDPVGSSTIPDACGGGLSLDVPTTVSLTPPTPGMVPVVTNVVVSLEIQHTWVGDLSGVLVAPNGKNRVLFQRPGTFGADLCSGAGGCTQDNLQVTFDDSAGNTYFGDFESTCDLSNSPGTFAISGDFQPLSPLSSFDGAVANGTWTLRLFDGAGGDVGDFIDGSISIDYAWATPNTLGANACDFTVPDMSLDPPVSDNCGFTFFNNYNGSESLQFASFPLGATTVDWTITDPAGNTDNCSQIIYVEGDPAPTTMTCPFGTLVVNDCYVVLPVAFDQCDIDQLTIQLSGFVNNVYSLNPPDLFFSGVDFQLSNGIFINTPGPGPPIDVDVEALDASGNVTNCSFQIDLQDFTSPTIGCPGDKTVAIPSPQTSVVVNDIGWSFVSENCDFFVDYTLTGATVGGACCDASGNNFNLGSTTVTYTATDNFGNSGNCAFTVNVANCQVDLGPDITECPGNQVILDAVNPNATYLWSTGETTQTIAVAVTNTYGVTVTDSVGCVASDAIVVTFQDDPVFVNCQNITVSLDAAGQATISALDVVASFDDCPVNPILSVTPSSFDCSSTGSNSVTVMITDSNNNTSSCNANVNVIDDAFPLIACQDFSAFLDEAGLLDISPEVIGQVSDNCQVQSTGVGPAYFSCADIGDNPVTISAVDVNGNVSICTVTVSVFDTLPPTMTCPGDTVIIVPPAQNSQVVGNIALICPLDNCGPIFTDFFLSGATMGNGTVDASGTAFNQGITTVTYETSDAFGNLSTCDFTVNIHSCSVDLGPDIAECIGEMVILDAGNAGAAFNWSTGATTQTITVTTSGNYQVTITDGFGCMASDDLFVDFFDDPPLVQCQNAMVSIGPSGNVTILPAVVLNLVTDDCTPDPILLVSPSTFSCNHIGNNMVTLTATDGIQQTATCTATVNVIDNLAPNIACDIITVVLDGNGQALVTANDLLTSQSDNCGIDAITFTPGSFDCTNIGPNTVPVTATDDNGNSTSCNATVNIEDDQPPAISCPVDTTVFISSGQNSATVNDIGLLTQGDNCSVMQIDFTLAGATAGSGMNNASGSTFNLGLTTVTYDVADPSGNISQCDFSVTVFNCAISLGPDITECPNTAVTLDPGNPNNATFTWNTGANTQTITVSTAGSYHVTVTDMFGCSAVDTVAVNYADNPPAVQCQNATIFLDSAGSVDIDPQDILASLSDDCLPAPALSVMPPSLNCNMTGMQVVTLRAVDASQQIDECVATVTVADNLPPVIVCQNFTVLLNSSNQAIITADDLLSQQSDNCMIQSFGLSQSAFNCSDIGIKNIQVTAVDNSNNFSTCTASVTVTDSQAPTITCPGNKAVIVQQGQNSATVNNLGLLTFSDNCFAPLIIHYTLQGATTGSGFGNAGSMTFNFGSTEFIYDVTDNSGNQAVCSFDVSVVNCSVDLGPDITACPGTAVTLDATGNPGSQYLWSTGAMTPVIQVSNNAQYQVTVTDMQGCTAADTIQVKFEDLVLPIALCQDVTIELLGDGMAVTGEIFVNDGSSDNCPGILELELSQTIFDCSEKGANPVTLTVTDANGNSNTCNATVTVVDNQVPVLDCPATLTVPLDENGQVSLGPDDLLVLPASDNCGLASLIADVNSLDCDDLLGTLTATLTATDDNGNVNSCAIDVTVTYDFPVIDCPADTFIAIPQVISSSLVFGIAPSFTACGGTLVNQINYTLSGATNGAGSGFAGANGLVFNAGTTTVTYTALDINGVVLQECTFSVVIDPVDPVNQTVHDPALDCISFDGDLADANISAPAPSPDCGVNGLRKDDWYVFQPGINDLTVKAAGSPGMTPVLEVFTVDNNVVEYIGCAEGGTPGGIATLGPLSLAQGVTHYARVYAKEADPVTTWFTAYVYETECPLPLTIPDSGFHEADKEFTDTSGWTHYIRFDSLLLLSIKKNGVRIGNINEGTIDVFIDRRPDTTFNVTGAPYVMNNQTHIALGSYWDVDVDPSVNTGTDTFGLRVYFTRQEFQTLSDFTDPPIEVDNPDDPCFYKINSFDAVGVPLDPDPSTLHPTIGADDIRIFTNGSASTTQWALSLVNPLNPTVSEFIGTMDVVAFSGGGLFGKGLPTTALEAFNEKDKIKVYPIPAASYLNIQLNPDLVGNGKLSLFDSFGRVVKIESLELTQLSSHQLLLNINKLSTGVYFLLYNEKDDRSGAKFIKVE